MPATRRAAAFALALALACGAALAISSSDREVQILANFPALQKIASKDADALRAFIKRVSAAYAKAGYDDFGPELRRSGSAVIAQFDNLEADDLKDARATLRRLESALRKDAFFVLPEAGKSLPDYFGIASTFLESGKVAVKNLSLGKNVANTLRNKRDTLWLANNGDGNFTMLSSGQQVGALTNSGAAGVLVVEANFAATSFLSGGVVTIGSGWTLLRPGLNGGTITLESTLNTYWIAFLPDAEIPADLSDLNGTTVDANTTINGIELAAGSKVYSVPNSYTAPASAILLTTPATTGETTPLSSSGGTSILMPPVTGESFEIPTPSPTPEE